MNVPTMQDMLEAGMHFGHQKSRWNPKMRRYIFMERNGIHVIDLKKSCELLEDAERHKLVVIQKDQRSGTYVVSGFAK